MNKKSKSKKSGTKEPNDPRGIVSRPSTATLPCRLTPDELSKQGEIMANTEAELSALEDQKKAATSEYKAKIDQAKARLSGAAALLRSKSEHRTVSTEIVEDYNTGTVEVIRTDTLERVSIRGMTDAERQLPLGADTGKDIFVPGQQDTGAAQAPALQIIGDQPETHAATVIISREQIVAALETIRDTGRASSAMLTRKLKVKPNVTAAIMDALERSGVVGPANGDQPREVLIDLMDETTFEKYVEDAAK